MAGAGYKDKLNQVDKAIAANAEFLNQIIADPAIFGHDVDSEDDDASEHQSENPSSSTDRLQQRGEDGPSGGSRARSSSHGEPCPVRSPTHTTSDQSRIGTTQSTLVRIPMVMDMIIATPMVNRIRTRMETTMVPEEAIPTPATMLQMLMAIPMIMILLLLRTDAEEQANLENAKNTVRRTLTWINYEVRSSSSFGTGAKR